MGCLYSSCVWSLAVLAIIIFPGSVLANTGDACIMECSTNDAGRFQSCTRCDGYLSCDHGTGQEMPCPANLVWHDDIKNCANPPSPTCTTNPTTTTTTTTSSTDDTTAAGPSTGSGCIMECSTNDAGRFQSCTTCNEYISCDHGITYEQPCPANLVWHDDIKNCANPPSPTCSTTP